MGQQSPGPAGWVTGAVAALVFLTGAARIAIDRVAGPVTANGPTSGAQAGAWFGAVMPGTSGSVDALLRIGDGAATGGPRIPAAPAGQVPSPANSALLGGQRFESAVAAGTLSAPSDASPSADALPAPSSSAPSAAPTNTPTASPSPAPPPSTTTTTSPPPATTTTTSPPPSSTTTTTGPPSTTSTTTPSSTTTTTSPPPAAPTSQG